MNFFCCGHVNEKIFSVDKIEKGQWENPEQCSFSNILCFFELLNLFRTNHQKILKVDEKPLLQMFWITDHIHLNLLTNYVKHRVSCFCFKNDKFVLRPKLFILCHLHDYILVPSMMKHPVWFFTIFRNICDNRLAAIIWIHSLYLHLWR